MGYEWGCRGGPSFRDVYWFVVVRNRRQDLNITSLFRHFSQREYARHVYIRTYHMRSECVTVLPLSRRAERIFACLSPHPIYVVLRRTPHARRCPRLSEHISLGIFEARDSADNNKPWGVSKQQHTSTHVCSVFEIARQPTAILSCKQHESTIAAPRLP